MSEQTQDLEQDFLDRWIAVQDMVRAGMLSKSDEMEKRFARIRNADDTGDLAGGIKEMDAILSGPKAAAAVPESDRPQLMPTVEPKPEKPLKVDTSAAEKRLDAKFDAFERELERLERSLGIEPEEPQAPQSSYPEIPDSSVSTEPPASPKAPPSATVHTETHAYPFGDPEERAVDNPFELPKPAADVFALPEEYRQAEPQEPLPAPTTQQPAPSQPVMTEPPSKEPTQTQEPQATSATQPAPSQPVTAFDQFVDADKMVATAADIIIPKGQEAAKAAEPEPLKDQFAPKPGETWDEQTERFNQMRKAIQEGRGGELTEPIGPKAAPAQPKEQPEWVKEQSKGMFAGTDALLAELAEKSGISPERHEELKSRAAAKAAEGGSSPSVDDGGMDAAGPGFLDILTGQAKLDWGTGEYEFGRTTAKPAKTWDEAQRSRNAAPSTAGMSGIGGGNAGGIGGLGGAMPITTNDVREVKDLLKEIRDGLKDKKKTGDQQQDQNGNSGFGSALPPRPTLLPNQVPPLKGTGK